MGTDNEGIAIQVFILALAIIFVISIFVILFFTKYQKKLLIQQRNQQQKEADYQRDLLKNTINSQEAERHRIARELHDEIGAMLTTTKLYSTQINSTLSPSQLEAVTHKMNHLFDDMIQNIRRITQDLRPIILEKLGLIEGIESLTQTISSSGQLTITFHHQIDVEVDKEYELNLYRILQELLNNTLKHAQANEVYITLQSTKNGCSLAFQDNGKGIDFQNHKFSKGAGLKNLESRVSAMSGKLEFMRVEGITSVNIQLPKLTQHKLNQL